MTEDGTRALRDALGCFGTGVALVTAQSPAGVAAITINSFASVSLHPGLVLWSLGEKSDSFAVFSTAETWGVSVLGAESEEVARRYAATGRAAAAPAEITHLEGTPVHAEALAAFSCRTYERHRLGDHLVIVGEVIGFTYRPGPGLSFFRGRFGALDAN